MLSLRNATEADAPRLREWDRETPVWNSDPHDESGWDWETELRRVLPWRDFLIAEFDGRPIGFIQIIDPRDEESHYWGDVEPNLRAIDIWIGAAADRGQGHGTQMMRLALARCFADPVVTAVLIDPLATNVRAIAFYQRLGFRFVERRKFGDDECAVHRLERADSS